MTLSGKLKGNIVLLGKEAIEELHGTSFYGRTRGDVLELSLPESAHLLYLGKITVELEGEELDFRQFFLHASQLLKNFELLYVVYKDLRERGYYVKPVAAGFRIYPRGGHPGKTPSEFFMPVTSERIPLQLSDLKKHLETVENLKKRFVLAIVDEESDITYYEVKRTAPSGSFSLKLGKLTTASLLEDRVLVWDAKASSLLHNEGFFGKPMDEGHLQLSLVESCYLLGKGILEIEKKDREKVDSAEFSKLASTIESDFMLKYAVYEKLRDRGLVPKTGFKFGTHFRVYKNFETLAGLTHSDYLVHAVEHEHVFSLQQLSRAVRLANSVRKEMIYSDSENFFVIGRMRL